MGPTRPGGRTAKRSADVYSVDRDGLLTYRGGGSNAGGGGFGFIEQADFSGRVPELCGGTGRTLPTLVPPLRSNRAPERDRTACVGAGSRIWHPAIVPGVTIGAHELVALGALVVREVPSPRARRRQPHSPCGWVCRCAATLDDTPPARDPAAAAVTA
ncbi:hypothetical protein GCM10009565_09330 [Amycolatopsis albidoflavus]